MKVAVLGCGPAGLIAAHAARSLGHKPTIFSERAQPSSMYGCQYLHSPIPQATDLTKVMWVDYMLQGPVDGYRRKVYGDSAEVELSPETLTRHHPAWDIRTTYMRLWDYYAAMIQRAYITPDNVSEIFGDFDAVVSTIPKTALCDVGLGHKFLGTQIIARGSATELGIHLDEFDCPPAMVICNGWDTPQWYRISNVFGYKTVEWPFNSWTVREIPGATVTKPVSNDCDCHPEIIHVGRYGAWRKGILASDVYSQTLTALRVVRV